MFKTVNLESALLKSGTLLRCYVEADLALGLEELRRAAPFVPVYLVRIEHGRITRRLRPEPVPTDQLGTVRLLPGVSGLACAYEMQNQTTLLIAAPGPLETGYRRAALSEEPALGNPYDRSGRRAIP